MKNQTNNDPDSYGRSESKKRLVINILGNLFSKKTGCQWGVHITAKVLQKRTHLSLMPLRLNAFDIQLGNAPAPEEKPVSLTAGLEEQKYPAH